MGTTPKAIPYDGSCKYCGHRMNKAKIHSEDVMFTSGSHHINVLDFDCPGCKAKYSERFEL